MVNVVLHSSIQFPSSEVIVFVRSDIGAATEVSDESVVVTCQSKKGSDVCLFYNKFCSAVLLSLALLLFVLPISIRFVIFALHVHPRPHQVVLPSPPGQLTQRQDHLHYSVWEVLIYSYAIWIMECPINFPKTNGQCARQALGVCRGRLG